MYTSISYYKNVYRGDITDDEVLERTLTRASMDIDSLTYNRIVKYGFDNLTDFQRDKVQYANCVQADYINLYGDYTSSPFNSYSINGVSLNSDTGINTVNGVYTPVSVYNTLKQTGLTVAQI